MPEWVYEQGIGENRAALIHGDEIIQAEVELPGTVRTGAIVAGALVRILVPKIRGLVRLDTGDEAILEPLPPGLTEGASLHVEILREPIPEKGRPKLARCRRSEAAPRPGPTLLERLKATGARVQEANVYEPDRLEAAGWSELIEQARTGEIPFDGGALRMSVTPAMTLFDVDGALPPPALASAGAAAAGRAIRRFGITGSIGLDLPTLAAKEDRQAAASALDAALPQPFERTAVNGFGFLQIVRRRERASIPELVQADSVGAAARFILRRAERSTGGGARFLRAAPPVIDLLSRNPAWLEAVMRVTGARVELQVDPILPLWSGHVHVAGE